MSTTTSYKHFTLFSIKLRDSMWLILLNSRACYITVTFPVPIAFQRLNNTIKGTSISMNLCFKDFFSNTRYFFYFCATKIQISIISTFQTVNGNFSTLFLATSKNSILPFPLFTTIFTIYHYLPLNVVY